MSQAQEVFLFNPTSVSGCQLWLDGADPNGTGVLPANGAALSTWKDKSSNAFSGTAVNSPTVQTNSINGLPTVQFNGTNQYINFGNILNLGTSQIYIFSVVRFTGDGSIVQKSSYRGFAGRWFLIRFAGDGGAEMGADATGSGVIAPFADTTTTPQLLAGYWDRSAVYTFQNGTQKASAALVSSANLSNTDILLVGAYGNATGTGPQAGFYLNGVIGEILIYLTSITTSQRQQIEGYLAWKWNLVGNLPSNHPFKTYRPLANTPIPTSVPPMPIVTQNVAAFSPPQISGCQLWFDGNDPFGTGIVPANGTSISTWTDKSGRGKNMTGQTPTFSTYSGQNSILFNNNSIANTSASVNVNTLTTFVVWLQQNAKSNMALFYLTNSLAYNNVGVGIYCDSTSTRPGGISQVRVYPAGIGSETSGNLPAATASDVVPRNITCIPIDSTGSFTIFVNGTSVASKTNASGRNVTANNSVAGSEGLPPGGNSIANVSEILVYNQLLTTAQRQQVEGYLAWKWGLIANLPNGHPYKTVPIAPFPSRSIAFNGNLGLWIPTQVSGINAWYDGADPLGTGRVPSFNTTLSTWFDKSGNGRNASGGVSPTFVNGGVSFNGSSTYLTMSIPYSSNYSIFLVATNTSVAQTYFFGRGPTVGSAPTFIQGYGTSTRLEWYNVNDRATLAEVPISPFITSVDHTQGSRVLGYYYGTQVFNITQSQGYVANVWDTLGQSGFGGGANWYGGIMKELIFYSNVVTTFQRQQVEGYLAWKWGLQANLPATHPYKKFPPSP